ncbi:hypothetical protein N8739_00675 [Luminiphilus sp.]|nr:hypothetical protein [Luminiphilus sp.]
MKSLLMLVPETVTQTVLQGYEGNFADDPSIKIANFGHFSSVAIAEDHPEAFGLMLKLKEECDRINDLIVDANEQGMERPTLLDSYGLAHVWSVDGKDISIEPYPLHGYAS